MNQDKPRRTKMIATLGPASTSPEMIEKMIRAGVDVFRVNFSHGKAEDHAHRIQTVRACAQKVGKEVGILSDLQGPKIRIARFKNNKITLNHGQRFILDADIASDAGDENQVGIDYKTLPQDVRSGDMLLLDDGRLELLIDIVEKNKIHCTVIVGGELSNNKGINRQGGGLSAKALTDKDKADLQTAISLGTDYIAVSFPRNAEDMHEARELVRRAGGHAHLIAKIERTEAVHAIEEIIQASDIIMVARGDLGVEIGFAEVPGVQKHIINATRAHNKVVITATQMMESMITNAIPTRAEVSDVANAVLDGTDAVMLSAETATGAHPDKVIEVMASICLGAERERIAQVSKHRMERHFERIDEAIAMATMYTANHLDIKAIIALTESGSTPLWMSRIRTGIPIYALTRHTETMRFMTLYRGVYPIKFDLTQFNAAEVNQQAVAQLEAKGVVSAGDYVILTKGDMLGVHGGTNVMKILEVGNVARLNF